ncbi:hypothetical protein JCM19301_551 [Jejuia pallidilutea]|uniref:Uncharacterized protein n=1 Tax=Jejuia pallidilutea TaxID=504487 RepID=A0A090VMT0_9FLAO|nr:hypothetical protein JCM19301_551 [Jejuia pallidilutea]GAL88048.1 hypothetical protein JCM19538_2411 [Jejuia pallidilutea]
MPYLTVAKLTHFLWYNKTAKTKKQPFYHLNFPVYTFNGTLYAFKHRLYAFNVFYKILWK